MTSRIVEMSCLLVKIRPACIARCVANRYMVRV